MSLNRFAKRRDANEIAIVRALESVGASVTRLSEHGVPDLLCGYRGETHLLEVKLPLGPKGGDAGHALNERQEGWWSRWTGRPPVVVRNVGEALAAIGAVL